MIDKVLCLLGIHGPLWFGNMSHRRSSRCESYVRVCTVCDKKWYGDQIVVRNVRTLGDWKTKEQLIASGEWLGDTTK